MTESFAHLQPVRDAFAGFDAPWFFCGGTALDLFLGRAIRPRHDIDTGVLRLHQQKLFHHFGAEQLFYVENKQLHAWNGKELSLPIHELYLEGGAFTAKNKLEILLSESDGDDWIYRRDPTLKMPITAVVLHHEGVPYLAPELVLLFKSKHMRPQDETDFVAILPSLGAKRRRWLADALHRTAPEHVWLPALKA